MWFRKYMVFWTWGLRKKTKHLLIFPYTIMLPSAKYGRYIHGTFMESGLPPLHVGEPRQYSDTRASSPGQSLQDAMDELWIIHCNHTEVITLNFNLKSEICNLEFSDCDYKRLLNLRQRLMKSTIIARPWRAVSSPAEIDMIYNRL